MQRLMSYNSLISIQWITKQKEIQVASFKGTRFLCHMILTWFYFNTSYVGLSLRLYINTHVRGCMFEERGRYQKKKAKKRKKKKS